MEMAGVEGFHERGRGGEGVRSPLRCPHGLRLPTRAFLADIVQLSPRRENDFPWRESSSPVRGGPLVTQNGILLEAAFVGHCCDDHSPGIASGSLISNVRRGGR